MTHEKNLKGFKKPIVDEDYLMNIMSGDEVPDNAVLTPESQKEIPKPKARQKTRSTSEKIDFENTFLVNRFPSGRNGKVVYIRPEYHERLQRIVQLTREERTTLYSYIDNILEHHFREFGNDITKYYNDKIKPIL